ncbi:DUF1707 domain-containing protein [Nocardia sp. 2]|uniref:DUF1707 domain-containing protein n=2 Tax=Nocardia acididurans TaxID=2802282 RepID=A0ABS1M1M5_9NOCA|nr:DUF1707 domain-containing protein [Nocardia acididurans]
MSGAEPAPVVGERDLRVSDSEREHVGRLLQRAVGLGMLSLGEFTERMDTALAAKTRGELNAVLVDLPGIRLVGQPAQPQQAPPRYVHTPQQPRMPQFAPSSVHPVMPGNVIRTRMSAVTRKGKWQVPPVLIIDSNMAAVELDFTQAIMSTQVVEIRVRHQLGSLELIVPSEATVDMNGLQLLGASVNNKVRTGPPLGPLHLIIHGQMRLGSITARHPFSAHWKRFLEGF